MPTHAASWRATSITPVDLAYVAVFAALIAALGQVSVFLGPVPFTLQTLGIALAGLCLGPWRGGAAVLLYLLIGAAGLPVFSGGRAGWPVLLGPSGGYLVSFLFAAILIGGVARWALGRGFTQMTPLWFLVGCVAARYLCILPLGVGWLAHSMGQGFTETIKLDIPFWGWDLAKNVIAVAIATAVHKAFPRLLAR